MTEKTKQVAVIGYGGMGGWHTRFIQQNHVVSLRGIYDIDPDRAALATENGIYAYPSFEAVLCDPEVDILVLAVPNELHKPLAIEGMAHGKHILSEKPVTLSSADLDDMIAASETYDRIFTVHQNRRWDVDYLMMKQIYASHELGEVFGVESRIQGSRGIPSDWRGKKEHGGGMILDWGVHLIDQLLGIVYDRKIEKIYCKCDHLTNDAVDDGFRLDLHFEGGLVGHIEVGTSHFIALPRFYMTGKNGSAIVEDWRDEAKVVRLKTWEEKDVAPVATAAGLTKTMAPRDEKTVKEYRVARMESDVHDFYRNLVAAIDGKEEQIVTHGQMRRVMKIMEAAFASDALGSPIPFQDIEF